MITFNHGSLFSGIGGFDLPSEWMGWNNVFHCEIEPFSRQLLQYYWPNSISYEDIKKTDFTKHRGTIDILTGGFPCQPYSTAGKRKGKEDDRHLWPEMFRAIREIQPTWIVGENVRGLVNWNGGLVFDEVQSDLEVEGYEVQPFLLPAASVGAPHQRYRIWFVAYNNDRDWKKVRLQTGREKYVDSSKRNEAATNPDSIQRPKRRMHEKEQEKTKRHISTFDSRYDWRAWKDFPTQPPVCSRNDGISSQLDGITFSKWRQESIKGYGNAVVPQLVYQIFKAIEEYERQQNIF